MIIGSVVSNTAVAAIIESRLSTMISAARSNTTMVLFEFFQLVELPTLDNVGTRTNPIQAQQLHAHHSGTTMPEHSLHIGLFHRTIRSV